MCTSLRSPVRNRASPCADRQRRRRVDAHPAGGRFRRLVVAGPGRDRGVGVPRLVGHRAGLPGPEPGPRLPDVVRGGRDPGRSAARRGAGVGVGARRSRRGAGRARCSSVGETRLSVHENRVDADRGGIVEWYVNDPRGLEQGFTIAARPEGEGPLVEVELTLSGTLNPRLVRGRPRDRLRRAERRPCAALRGTGRDGRAREGVAGVVRGLRRGRPARDPDRRRRRGRRVPGDDRSAGDEPRLVDVGGSCGELRLRRRGRRGRQRRRVRRRDRRGAELRCRRDRRGFRVRLQRFRHGALLVRQKDRQRCRRRSELRVLGRNRRRRQRRRFLRRGRRRAGVQQRVGEGHRLPRVELGLGLVALVDRDRQHELAVRLHRRPGRRRQRGRFLRPRRRCARLHLRSLPRGWRVRVRRQRHRTAVPARA